MDHPAPTRSPVSASEIPSQLEGQVERITFVNEETGYTVARVKVEEAAHPITVVGNLLALAPGEVLEMKGVWESHPKFGRQFRVVDHRTRPPVTVKGIKTYLGSGLVKGIGPVTAERIVTKFGRKTLEIIDQRTDELTRVEGIGQKRVEMIRKAWADQKEVRSVMIFLQEHGVSLSHAAKIFKRYGQRSIAVVSQNPYRLATEISGVGFQTADKIAGHMGFRKTAPVRAEAGVLYVLGQTAEEGHVFYPYELLIARCQEILDVDRAAVVAACQAVAREGKIVIEVPVGPAGETGSGEKAVYLTRLHVAECGVAAHLSQLIAGDKKVRRMDPVRAVQWVQGQINLELAPEQARAIRGAVSDKVFVITGGPGTGKTTIIHAVIQIYAAVGAEIMMAAPTGRAAKRMAEATGRPAKTLHRMLEFSWHAGGFQRNENHRLEADVIIIDEASMIDTPLMYHFLKAVPPKATVILVGDVHQLPSVGPGNVLRDIIQSATVGVVALDQIFRQARESRIVTNAHRINQGMMPEMATGAGHGEDFYFIEQEDPRQVLDVILELACKRIPRRFGMDPLTDIQVLTPMHKGDLGTENLNLRLQETLNPGGGRGELGRGRYTFRTGDKVMQIRNNYEKEVFNGDIGLIAGVDERNQEVRVAYDAVRVSYEAMELDEIVPAYAVSVHKSQGSEYPAVILPIMPQHYLLLQRNLIYTAVTRGRKLVVLVGSKKALAMGVKREGVISRHTGLAGRLKRF